MQIGIAVFANTFAQAESLLHRQKQTAGNIGHHLNANKTQHMCFKPEGVLAIILFN